jgi:hypothetical protein
MSFLNSITFDQIALSFMVCFALRAAMIAFLPNTIAGPDGWLVDTGV